MPYSTIYIYSKGFISDSNNMGTLLAWNGWYVVPYWMGWPLLIMSYNDHCATHTLVCVCVYILMYVYLGAYIYPI